MATDDAFMRAMRACHWRTAQLRHHGIEPIRLTEAMSHYPPEDFDWAAAEEKETMEATIEPGTHWNHKGDPGLDGYGVTVVELPYPIAKTKAPGDANWHNAVAYTVDGGAFEEGDDVLLIRTVADFRAKFTQDERLGDEA